MNVPFLDVKATWTALQPELEAATARVMESGWYIGGPEVSAFEAAFAAYVQANHCVGVGNGLDALRLALTALGIGPGDEVIVPSHTFIASWLGVSQVGATPVPVEPADGTFLIDPDRIEAAITPKTRAIMPVHLYGHPAPMEPILDCAARHGIPVLEDAAQAQGAQYQGRRIGAHAHVVAWSFYPGKNLGAFGDAGAVTTNDAELSNRIRMLANYGSREKYAHEVQGTNTRLDPLQAALLGVKLTHLDQWNDRRREIAATYSNALSGLPIDLPNVATNADPVWHLYVIRSQNRDALQAHLTDQGVATVMHYPTACIDQEAYRDMPFDPLHSAVARQMASEVLSLPIGPHMSDAHVDAVIAAVRSFH